MVTDAGNSFTQYVLPPSYLSYLSLVQREHRRLLLGRWDTLGRLGSGRRSVREELRCECLFLSFICPCSFRRGKALRRTSHHANNNNTPPSLCSAGPLPRRLPWKRYIYTFHGTFHTLHGRSKPSMEPSIIWLETVCARPPRFNGGFHGTFRTFHGRSKPSM